MELGEVVTTTKLREDQRGDENHVGKTKPIWEHMDPVILLSLSKQHACSILSSKTFRTPKCLTAPVIQFPIKQETDPAGETERRKSVFDKWTNRRNQNQGTYFHIKTISS